MTIEQIAILLTILVTIAGWIVTAFNQRRLNDRQNAFEKENTLRQANLDERRDLLTAIQSALASGYTSTHPKVIEAHELLWSRMLMVREFTGRFIFFYWLLVPSEYQDIIDGKARGIVPHISKDEFDAQLTTLSSGIENKRIFLGEELWGLYQIYFAFSMREALKVQTGIAKGKIYEWDKDFKGNDDTGITRILQDVFTDVEFKAIRGVHPMGVPQRFVSALESKILLEMNQWAFGQRFAKMSFDEQFRIQELLASLASGADADVPGD